MNIYVISNVWAREGSAIVGAATDADLAEDIADRVGAYQWGPWEEHGGTRERVAMLADGTEWPKLRQEIVCLPLAGVPVISAGEPVRFVSKPIEISKRMAEAIRSLTTPRD